MNLKMDEIWKPLADAIEERYCALERPCFVGLCGPQGSGKSTGGARLQDLLASRRLRTAIVSLDDFYLTRADRMSLARDVHPLLVTRGPPGTHDLALGRETTSRLLAGESIAIPLFAKHLDDRADPANWPWFDGPADIVVLEGWCVGVRPQLEASLDEPINDLERDFDQEGIWRRHVNSALHDYQSWFESIDYLIQLRPPSFGVVARWRMEQEETLRAKLGKEEAASLMSAEEIERFVQHYERITITLMKDGPVRANAIIDLDENRRPQRVSR
jgi:D-glycerate 3-kinase